MRFKFHVKLIRFLRIGYIFKGQSMLCSFLKLAGISQLQGFDSDLVTVFIS